MIRLADYVAQTLAAHGVRQVFLVTGGGAMHLNDAIGRCKELRWVACHHEQACAIAAESYFRLTNRLAAVNVTTGPGGTNALTGVYGAWTDSIGMIVVSGQVRYDTTVASTGLPLRQLGDQEIDIVAMARPITKYAVMVHDPATIRYHLERALHLAVSGRPGPVWIDIPMNVQGASIDPAALAGYDPAEDPEPHAATDVAAAARDVLARLRAAERPVLLAGTGVRIAGAAAEWLALVDRLGVPVVTPFNAHDLVPEDHPQYVGRPGTVGDRPGNFAVQNADLLLVVGCRMNIRQIGFNWPSFARAAHVVMVDVDPAELAKPTLKVHQPILADARDFVTAMSALPWDGPTAAHATWLAWCRERVARYPIAPPAPSPAVGPVNPYRLVEALWAALPADAIVVTGDGTACVTTFQGARIQDGQRLYSNSGAAAMGYDLPAAIGAAFGAADPATGAPGRVVCMAGDGSIMMNLQELQTIATHRLPMTIVLVDNAGYLSIRQTQMAYFADSPIGFDEASGVGFPDFAKLADAFGLAYRRVSGDADLEAVLAEALRLDGPVIVHVPTVPDQAFTPKLASRRLEDGRMVSSPLEDLAPFLPREELARNLLIPPVAD